MKNQHFNENNSSITKYKQSFKSKILINVIEILIIEYILVIARHLIKFDIIHDQNVNAQIFQRVYKIE